MRKLILVVALAAACEGPRGPQGPAGPAGPGIDRAKIYCATQAGAIQAANVWRVNALCHSSTDVPLSGDCFLPAVDGVSHLFFLSDSQPVAWSDAHSTAAWTCEWSPAPGAPIPATFPGVAEICCYTP